MSSNIFDGVGADVFSDRDRLREDYVPENIVERDEELGQLRNGLAPVMNGYSPDHIFVPGPHGSGKTVCTAFVLDQLKQKVEKNNRTLALRSAVNSLLLDAFPSQTDNGEPWSKPSTELLSEYRRGVGHPIVEDLPESIVDASDGLTEQEVAEIVSGPAPDDRVDLTIRWVNCAGVSTGYQLAIRIANSFRQQSEKLSESGYANQRVYDEMFTSIEEAGEPEQDGENRVGTILLVLDEIGIVEDLDTLFYKLSRAGGKGGGLNDTQLGTICLSNNTSFRDQFSSRTDSSYSVATVDISFDAYDANQLRSVLQARADEAYRCEALSSDVIPLCAAIASKNGGDARLALQLLLKAGDVAMEEGSQVVEEDHVRESKRRIERQTVVGAVERYSTSHQLALLTTAIAIENADRHPEASELHAKYCEFAHRGDTEPVKQRQFSNYLKLFREDGLISATSDSPNQPAQFKLSYPAERVRRAIPKEVLNRYLSEDTTREAIDPQVE